MRLHLLAAATAITLALAGCANSGGLHPDGTSLDPSSLKAERSLAGVTISPAAWPTQDWWSGLGDAQLASLIDEALKDNPGLAAADARARQAQAAAGEADAAREVHPDSDLGRDPGARDAYGCGDLEGLPGRVHAGD